MIDAHLAASICADPAGDAKLARIHETLDGYRQKAKASSASLSGSDVGLLSHFKDKPVEAGALDMLLCMALNRTSAAAVTVGPGHEAEVAAAPLAWLCDEEETPKVALRIVDTVWPPDSTDQV